MNSAQSRIPIQVLDEARDAIQTLHVGPTTITTGSVDGHTRTYDIRKGEICSDYLGRVSFLIYMHGI
jgi:mitogen-activated protein kinase organizer 1